jgi:hypothetical protein
VKYKVQSVILGTLCLLYGLFVIARGEYYSSQFEQYIDFGKYHILIGAFITIVGVLFIYVALKKKKQG